MFAIKTYIKSNNSTKLFTSPIKTCITIFTPMKHMFISKEALYSHPLKLSLKLLIHCQNLVEELCRTHGTIQTRSRLRQERNESTNLFNIFRYYTRRMQKDICEGKVIDTLKISYDIADERINRRHHSTSSHETNGQRMT